MPVCFMHQRDFLKLSIVPLVLFTFYSHFSVEHYIAERFINVAVSLVRHE
jgi:hypothetical protein